MMYKYAHINLRAMNISFTQNYADKGAIMYRVKLMTKPVITTNSGKVQGIRGLYKDPSSNRYYVRYSFHGIDKQLTIYPKCETFSGLERAAAQGLGQLKKQVKATACDVLPVNVQSPKDRISCAQAALIRTIEEHWGKRGTTQKHIKRLLQFTRGMCLCGASSKPKEKAEINAHNLRISRDLVEDVRLSGSRRREAYRSIQTVFSELIHACIHHGDNPAAHLIRPKEVVGVRDEVLTFDDAARVIMSIRKDEGTEPLKRAEAELFLRLCMETGQRPIDIHMWTPARIDTEFHYQFVSHKTARKHRAKHIISKRVQELASMIIIQRGGVIEYQHELKNAYAKNEAYDAFWRYSQRVYEDYINGIIKRVIGPEKSVYCARHFFVSEVFKMTESEFWAEVFTHEGKTANTRHYLHVDQKKADEILLKISSALDDAIYGV